MARVLFIGDPHLKINRFDLAIRFLSWIDTVIATHKPDIVVNLGDTFDDHAVLRSEIMTEFMNHVNKTLALNIPYIYLLGNHDLYKVNDYKYHALKHLVNKISNFFIIDETTDLFDMTFVPYQVSGKTFPTTTLPICVAHQTFIEADYGMIRTKEGVDRRTLINCQLLISGHIHTRQRLVADATGPELVYVGSPFSQSASDIDQVKGVSIIDTSTYVETFIENPLPMWRGLRATVSDETPINVVHEMVVADISNTKHHWVLELTGPKAEITGYISSIEYKAAVANVDVKLKTNFTDREKKKVSIEAKSMEHILSEYITKVYNGAIDKDKLLECSRSILKTAQDTANRSS